MLRLLIVIFLGLFLSACSATREIGLGCNDLTQLEIPTEANESSSVKLNFYAPPTIKETSRMKPEEANENLNEYGRKWLYGHGMGQTITNVGGVVIFPPYAIYLLGNAVISLSGYEPLHVTELLPSDPCSKYNSFYDNVTSVPGRLSAAIAGEEFVER